MPLAKPATLPGLLSQGSALEPAISSPDPRALERIPWDHNSPTQEDEFPLPQGADQSLVPAWGLGAWGGGLGPGARRLSVGRCAPASVRQSVGCSRLRGLLAFVSVCLCTPGWPLCTFVGGVRGCVQGKGAQWLGRLRSRTACVAIWLLPLKTLGLG